MYNVVEKVRAGRDLNRADQVALDTGQVMSLIEYHDRIDQLTLNAYGLDVGMTDIALLTNLIELNKVREAEERLGIVHWLRPAFQNRLGGAETVEADEMDLVVEVTAPVKPPFPSEPIEQAGAVATALLA
jgi:hypothetical protein